jgi:hypothetical protein
MADGKFFATELDREADKHMGHVVRLRELAEQVRALPVANLPTAELRALLGRLGFCVVPVDALAHAERALRTADLADDGLGMHGTGPSEQEAALAAVQEAITFTTHARLPSLRAAPTT